ncbi:46126_t:CDS:10 [Gigaspora margarita]|uniref:46126_t:CDS:1 n=1 Tax=Gigaspora margarita TaxID=4874 RepID=A0ABN7UX21_GIGMA|nr:46126_t:CDS:10 [Gigaspora margarita]
MQSELQIELNRRDKKRYLEELSELENTTLNLLIFNPVITAGTAYYFWDKLKTALSGEIKENNSILKACGYCLKVFKSDNKNKVGCDDCEIRISLLIRRGTLSNFWPKTLETRIKELEEEVEEIKRKVNGENDDELSELLRKNELKKTKKQKELKRLELELKVHQYNLDHPKTELEEYEKRCLLKKIEISKRKIGNCKDELKEVEENYEKEKRELCQRIAYGREDLEPFLREDGRQKEIDDYQTIGYNAIAVIAQKSIFYNYYYYLVKTGGNGIIHHSPIVGGKEICSCANFDVTTTSIDVGNVYELRLGLYKLDKELIKTGNYIEDDGVPIVSAFSIHKSDPREITGSGDDKTYSEGGQTRYRNVPKGKKLEEVLASKEVGELTKDEMYHFLLHTDFRVGESVNPSGVCITIYAGNTVLTRVTESITTKVGGNSLVNRFLECAIDTTLNDDKGQNNRQTERAVISESQTNGGEVKKKETRTKQTVISNDDKKGGGKGVELGKRGKFPLTMKIDFNDNILSQYRNRREIKGKMRYDYFNTPTFGSLLNNEGFFKASIISLVLNIGGIPDEPFNVVTISSRRSVGSVLKHPMGFSETIKIPSQYLDNSNPRYNGLATCKIFFRFHFYSSDQKSNEGDEMYATEIVVRRASEGNKGIIYIEIVGNLKYTNTVGDPEGLPPGKNPPGTPTNPDKPIDTDYRDGGDGKKINEVNAFEQQELKNEIAGLKEQVEILKEEIKKLTEKQQESELIAQVLQVPPPPAYK